MIQLFYLGRKWRKRAAIAVGIVACGWLAGRWFGSYQARSEQTASARSTARHFQEAQSTTAKADGRRSVEGIATEAIEARVATLIREKNHELYAQQVRKSEHLYYRDRTKLLWELSKETTPVLLQLEERLRTTGGGETAENIVQAILLPRDALAYWHYNKPTNGGPESPYKSDPDLLSQTFEKIASQHPALVWSLWQNEVLPLLTAEQVQTRPTTIPEILQKWARSDRQSAFAVALTLPRETERLEALAHMGWAIQAYLDTPKATEGAEFAGQLIEALGSSAEAKLRSKLKSAFDEKLELNPERISSLIEWAEAIPAEETHRRWIDKALADAWMTSEPAAAADWYLSRAGDDPAQRSVALERLMRKWTDVPHSTAVMEGDFLGAATTANFRADLDGAAEWLTTHGSAEEIIAAMEVLRKARAREAVPPPSSYSRQ